MQDEVREEERQEEMSDEWVDVTEDCYTEAKKCEYPVELRNEDEYLPSQRNYIWHHGMNVMYYADDYRITKSGKALIVERKK
jgi:hypothetical protein